MNDIHIAFLRPNTNDKDTVPCFHVYVSKGHSGEEHIHEGVYRGLSNKMPT